MKILFLIFLLLFISNCSSKKGVYWCGDHPCINKKEKEAYFKKTMIVEVKKIKNNDEDNYSDIQKITQQAKLNEKKRIKGKKDLEKLSKLEEKRLIKEEKKLAKINKLEEKRRLKEEKRLEKLSSLEEKKRIKRENDLEKKITQDEKKQIIKKTEKDYNKIVELKDSAKSINNEVNNFDELVKSITNRNKFKPYPDINDIPK